MPAEVGQPAPDFTLKDQQGQEVTLSDFRGQKNVVVLFHPHAFTANCEGELCKIQEELPRFRSEDVETLAISIDSVFVHRVWGEQQGFDFPLLADFWPHGAVAQAYGCFDEVGGRAMRATYIVDKEGIVRWKVVNNIPDVRDHEEYLKVLADL